MIHIAPSRWRRSIQRLGQWLKEPAALSWRVGLVYLPFSLAGPLLIDRERFQGGWIDALLLGLSGQMAVMVVLAIGYWWLRADVVSRAHGVFALVTLAVAVLARALVLAGLSVALGLTSDFELEYRILGALVVQWPLLLIIALGVSSLDQRLSIARELVGHQAHLDQINQSLNAQLGETHMALALQVKRSIEPSIDRLCVELDRLATTDSAELLHESIRSIVDDELRPLSQRILMDATSIAEVPRTSHALTRATSFFRERLPLGVLMQPLLIGILAGLLAVSQAIRGMMLPEMILFPLAGATLMFAIIAAIRAVVWNVTPPLWFAVVMTMGITSGGLGLVLVILGTVIVLPGYLSPATFIVGGLIGGLTSVYAAVGARRLELEAELEKSVERLQVKSSLLRQRTFMSRRHLSYIIHGSIQTSLNAAALRLAESERPSPDVILTIRRDLNNAVSRLDEPESPYTVLVGTLRDIAELWEGVCAVHWSCDHSTIALIAASPAAAASTAEIVRECVGNAVRHGGATSVQAVISSAGDRIRIRVTDDGSGVSEGSRRGLGSVMLDEMCIDWSRGSLDGGTVVQAEVACDPFPRA